MQRFHAHIASILNKAAGKRDGLSILFEHGLISISAFISSLLVARSVDKESFGNYVLALSFIWICQAAHRGLISVPYTVLLPKTDFVTRPRFLGDTLIYTTIFTLLLILIFSLIASTTAIFDTTGDIDLFTIAIVIAFASIVFREHLRSVMFAMLQISKVLGPSISAVLTNILLVTVFYQTNLLDGRIALTVLAASSLLTIIFMLISLRHDIALVINGVLSRYGRLWRTGKWNLVNVFWSSAATQAYPWLIAYMLGSEAVAVYGAGFALSNLLAPLARGANSYILPKLAHHLQEHGAANLSRAMRKSVLVLALPFGLWFLLGIFTGDRLLTLLFSDKYQGYGFVAALLIAKAALEGVSIPAIAALQSIEKPNVITHSFMLGTLFTFTVGLYLILRFDLLGAAIAIFLSAALAVIYRWAVLSRIMKS